MPDDALIPDGQVGWTASHMAFLDVATVSGCSPIVRMAFNAATPSLPIAAPWFALPATGAVAVPLPSWPSDGLVQTGVWLEDAAGNRGWTALSIMRDATPPSLTSAGALPLTVDPSAPDHATLDLRTINIHDNLGIAGLWVVVTKTATEPESSVAWNRDGVVVLGPPGATLSWWLWRGLPLTQWTPTTPLYVHLRAIDRAGNASTPIHSVGVSVPRFVVRRVFLPMVHR